MRPHGGFVLVDLVQVELIGVLGVLKQAGSSRTAPWASPKLASMNLSRNPGLILMETNIAYMTPPRCCRAGGRRLADGQALYQRPGMRATQHLDKRTGERRTAHYAALVLMQPVSPGSYPYPVGKWKSQSGAERWLD